MSGRPSARKLDVTLGALALLGLACGGERTASSRGPRWGRRRSPTWCRMMARGQTRSGPCPNIRRKAYRSIRRPPTGPLEGLSSTSGGRRPTGSRPLWQNCGFYEKPIEDRHAVHSLDHGVVWITYRLELPAEQVETLHSYGRERYVIVSPYPGQEAPVIGTSWRVQLQLDSAGDPRLGRFVDGFRVSEIAPLSGNRCVGGVGNPQG